ncbi:MAG: tetratricopeptide repeat protein [Thermoplasmata archaeon]|jgi:tetratricopeptide (TPR) repeat protein
MVGARGDRRSADAPPVGRDEVLEEVGRALRHTRDGHGEGILLTGPGGAGKSFALRAVVQRAASQGFRVLEGRALPEELPAPFSLVRDLLASTEEERPLRSPTPEATVLPIFLAPFGQEVTSGGPTSAPRSRAAPLGDDLERLLAPLGRTSVEGLGASREEMLGRLGEHFRALAADAPLLLVIDDLQFGDASSFEFLRRLSADLPNTRIAVVATVAVGAEIPERNRTSVDALAHAPSFRSVLLRALTVPEVTEFVRWILGGRPPDPQDVRRWHAQTEGNPLFIEQLVHAATGFGPRIGTPSEPTGRDVTEILLNRVRELGDSELRLLTYAAVLGKEFDFSSLAAVAGMGEERVTENLDRLVQAGLIREKGGEVYEFVTEAVRASVYASLTETRRRILHRKAGRALAMKRGTSDFELARQFYLGRDDARAVEYNVRAAQAATRAFAFETAVAHIARALEAERRRPGRDPRLEVRLLTETGRLLDEVGSLPRSEEALSEAVDLARGRPGLELELGRALLGLAQTRTDRSEYDSAESLADEATTLLERAGTPRDQMAAHRVLGTVYWRRGDLARAEAHQRSALEIAEKEGSAIEQGHVLVDVANTMVPLGILRFDPALALYARAADLFGTVEDHGARARVLMNRAVLEYGAGRTDEAFRDMALAIEAAERSRSPIWIGYSYVNLAQWHAELCRPALARPALERAAEALGPTGDRLGDQQIAMTRGMVSQAEGSYDDAEAHFQDALAHARALRLGSEVSEMLFRLAELSHLRGDTAEARRRLAEAQRSGILDHRPDLSVRVAALERVLDPGR